LNLAWKEQLKSELNIKTLPKEIPFVEQTLRMLGKNQIILS